MTAGKGGKHHPQGLRCGSVETCRNASRGSGREVWASGGSHTIAGCMASVTLKDIKKIYPNTETKKKKKHKKGEPEEKKANLQITAEGVVAVQKFSAVSLRQLRQCL